MGRVWARPDKKNLIWYEIAIFYYCNKSLISFTEKKARLQKKLTVFELFLEELGVTYWKLYLNKTHFFHFVFAW